ncbi:MAG: hypothetical protein Q8N90_01295 [bacterium]|nr:hypothetical protein [bacterium]
MAKQTITRLLKTVYPYLKDESGIPPWLFPERSLNQTIDAVGDSGLLRVGRPLGMVAWVDSAPDPASVSPQEWHNAIREWPPLPKLSPMMTAFVEVAEPIMAQFAKVRPAIDPLVICRSLAVLLYAPLVDQGKVVSEDLAGVLGEQASQPTRLVASYAEAMVRGDIPTVEKVHQCILKYSDWREWALALQKEVLRCRLRPKLIAVTPPLSTELTSVLATMLKEEYDESRGDHSAHSGDQILAQ